MSQNNVPTSFESTSDRAGGPVFGALLLAASVSLGLYLDLNRTPDGGPPLSVSEPIRLSLQSGRDVVTIPTQDHRLVLLNFWATWCGPCKAEIPILLRMQEDLTAELVVVALSVDELPESQILDFARRNNMGFAVGLADAKVRAVVGGPKILPLSLLLDENGTLLATHSGALDQNAEREIRSEIRKRRPRG